MSVDLERENFHVNVVRVRDLEDFLSAQTYRPEITTAYQVVLNKSHKLLDDLCSEKISQGSTPIYAENGPLCLKSKDVDELLTGSNINTYVDINWALSNSKNKISFETLLLTRQGVGTIGRCAIYFGDSAYTNDSIFKIVVTKADSAYVTTFLNTDIGKRLIEKGVYGSTGQLNLSVSHVKKLPIFLPNSVVQKYIGDKVRQAELLREWAKSLEKDFSEILISFCSDAFKYVPSGKKHSLAPLYEISHTLNPGAFNEKRLFIRKKLRELDAKILKDVVDIYSPTTNEYTENTPYIGLDAINSNSCEITSSTVKASGVVGTARVLYEGVVISKLRPYLNKVSYIPKVFEGAVGSTELLCLKAKNNSISNWYLYGVLKSDLVLNQLEPLSTGSTHPRIDRYDIYDLIIPILPNNHELGDNLQKAQNGYLYSQKLLKMSTSLVESVIDGIISEEELIQAQNALEQGDTSLDRAILSLMTEEGYAVASSKPLFSDLDEFYDLLEQAKALE